MEIAEKNELDVIPVYVIRRYSKVRVQVFFFVFPPVQYDSGLILNDKQAMQPEEIFRVDLNALILSGQQRLVSY